MQGDADRPAAIALGAATRASTESARPVRRRRQANRSKTQERHETVRRYIIGARNMSLAVGRGEPSGPLPLSLNSHTSAPDDYRTGGREGTATRACPRAR
jgi:hypothetical protein